MVRKLLCTIFLVCILAQTVHGLSATISVPDRYSEVDAGESIFFMTEIKWPENTMRQDLRLEYSIRDSEGREIAYLKALKAVETQASFMDSLTIPPSASSGLYRVYLVFSDYDDLNEEIAASFRVYTEEPNIFSTLNIILMIVSFIALAIVIELFMIMKKLGH